jgi:uncharacterized protein with PIN domain
LIRVSRDEDRILLSLDTRLLVRRKVDRFIFLQNRDLQSQLRQILGMFRQEGLPSPPGRCLSCNEILSDIPAESVRNRVPEYVFKHHAGFKICPACRKIFWPGTHRKSVLKTLQRLLQDAIPDAQPEGRVPDTEESRSTRNADTHPKR